MREHKNFWDKNAGRYDRFMRKDRAAYEKMYELIRPIVKNKTVLELATGTGLIAKNIVNAAAHHAVEGLLGALLKVAALRVGDVLHDVQALRAALGAGVAADAGVDLRVELHHDGLLRADLLDVIDLLDQREEGEGGDVHVVLDLGLAGETDLELAVAGDAVDRGARAAEAVAAAAAADELIARVLHGLHDGQVGGNLVLFSEQKDANHILHV